MIILIINILKKLPAVCWRIFNGDKWRISVQSAEDQGKSASPSKPVCTMRCAIAARRKIWIDELANLHPEWEKPPPFACAAP